MRLKLRVQDYRGADSVIMAEEQKPEKAADGEVTVYAALALSLIHSSRSDCATIVIVHAVWRFTTDNRVS